MGLSASRRAPDAAPTECANADEAEAFARRVRSSYGVGPNVRVSGTCVLDVDARNILTFEQGRWELFEKDARAAFGKDEGERIARLVDARGAVSAAFGIRRNVVNLKKVLLQSQYEIEGLELRLRQLSTFYRGDFGKHAGYRNASRFREIVTAHGRCRGAAKAIFDGRVFTKQICCVPRFPKSLRPRRLASMPRSLVSYGFVEKALERSAGENFIDKIERGVTIGTPCLTEDFDELVRAVREEMSLPEHSARFIESALIARGAAKAMMMRRELVDLLHHVSAIAEDTARVARTLRTEHKSPDQVLSGDLGLSRLSVNFDPSREALEALSRASKMDAVVSPLEGAAPALAELKTWIAKILNEPEITLFAAGDDEHTSAFVPEGFALRSIIAAYAPVVEKYSRAMLDELAKGVHASDAAGGIHEHISGTICCKTCERTFAKIWVRQHTCVSCEERSRELGRCPIKSECDPRFFCSHARACLRCERVSCEHCGVVRGDAEDVVSLVENIDAQYVFLDFDRTICATKAGSSPLPKNFRALDPEGLARACERYASDADLVGLLRSHSNCFIVTRNSNVEAIECYLKQHGVSAPKVARAVKGESKGEVISRLLDSERREIALEPSGPSVFVDDDVRELLREDVRGMANMHRVLFTRESKHARA